MILQYLWVKIMGMTELLVAVELSLFVYSLFQSMFHRHQDMRAEYNDVMLVAGVWLTITLVFA